MSWHVYPCERGHISSFVGLSTIAGRYCQCGAPLGEAIVVVKASLDGPGQARRDDPGTAKKAANVNVIRRGTQRWQVLAAIATCGGSGRTSHELEEVTGIRYASLTPRIGELKRGGFIEANGQERRGKYGVDQEVVIATAKGFAVLNGARTPSMYDPGEDG